ncbi:MAG: hypothetical protein A2148_07025 [Chloroflexi bacterium RBG_16_68_14]|nr:MAG: hypothetical protein A2148_07025 [Chloroflexi bacterium RBG_16_68_14]
MPLIRYPQFCALARAAELIGERWTLLIIRELLLGPKRFSDLRSRLPGISSSVLAERLTRLDEADLVQRAHLEPPAASSVYELTGDGRALEPVIFALIRWGARYLFPARPGEQLEPEWIRLVLAAYARKGRTPAHSFEIRMPAGEREVVVHVAGGAKGTAVAQGGSPADATLVADAEAVLGLMAGILRPADALRQGQIRAQGDLEALSVFPHLFDVTEDRR